MNISGKVAAIQFDGDIVRVALVKTGGKRPKLLEFHTARAEAVDEESSRDALVSVTRELLHGLSTRPTMITLCISNRWSVARQITIPFRGRRVADAVPGALEPHMAFPIEELLIDHLILRESGGETEVLAVCLRREIVEDQLAILEETGHVIEGVGLDILGATALWQSQAPPVFGAHALLHVGEHGTALVGLIDKKLVYIRSLDVSRQALQDAPAAAAQVIKNELRAFEINHNESESLDFLVLTGVAENQRIRDALEPELGLSLSIDDLSSAVADVGVVDGERNEWISPVGVAFASAGSAISLNFLEQARSAKAMWRGLSRHFVATIALALVGIGAYLAYCFVDYRNNMNTLDRVSERIWEEFSVTFPESRRAAQRPAGDIGGFKTYELMLEEVEIESELSQAISVERLSKPTLLDILSELAQKIPEDQIAITNLSVTTVSATKKIEITVTGTVKDSTKFTEFLQGLETSSVFDVDLGRVKRTSSGGKETFSIIATR